MFVSQAIRADGVIHQGWDRRGRGVSTIRVSGWDQEVRPVELRLLIPPPEGGGADPAARERPAPELGPAEFHIKYRSQDIAFDP